MERIRGAVSSILFRNAENDYVVAILKADIPITIVGYSPFVEEGLFLELEGKWKFNPKYEVNQFHFSGLRIRKPDTIEDIRRFLSSEVMDGIGPVYAKAIVDEFGLDSFDIINYRPEKLMQISGIGKKRMESIVDSYRKVLSNQEMIMFLQQFGFSMDMIRRIHRIFGDRVIQVINENPYLLSAIVKGISFKRADQIGMKLGIDKDSPFRISAYIRYFLENESNKGNTYMQQNELIESIARDINISYDKIGDQIHDLVEDGSLIAEERNGESRLFLYKFYQAENYCAYKLNRVDKNESLVEINLDGAQEYVKAFEEERGVKLAQQQKEAALGSLSNKISVITGGPGTGKTTIVNVIIKISQRFNLKIALAAPTGRAAKRMKESTGYEAKTIHRLLDFHFSKEEGRLTFGRDEDNPIEADLIIIDESSMINVELFENLMKAVSLDSRLILIGDVDQLPPIGAGNVLKDVILSGEIATYRLTEIFRQGSDSNIVTNAHRINSGEMPMDNSKDGDFFSIREDDKSLPKLTLDLVSTRLPKAYNLDPIKDIQVLMPMRNGMFGTNEFNRDLQEILNPHSPKKRYFEHQNTIYREGDKVMQTRNDYGLAWEDFQTGEKGEGVFNGDIGYIELVEPNRGLVIVRFDENRIATYRKKNLEDLDLAYAITIHKAQGSEFKAVVLPIGWIPIQMSSRNLLYTAVTRGKELVVIVGNQKSVKDMVDQKYIESRNTTLGEKIVSEGTLPA